MLATIRNFISNEVCGRKARFLIAYIIAAYACRIPGYFINWGTPGDLQVSMMTWWDHLSIFFIMPFFAPVYLYCTVRLTFLWGISIIPEGLLPIAVFVSTFVLVIRLTRGRVR